MAMFFYLFFRIWRYYPPEFPREEFNTLPDNKIEDAIRALFDEQERAVRIATKDRKMTWAEAQKLHPLPCQHYRQWPRGPYPHVGLTGPPLPLPTQMIPIYRLDDQQLATRIAEALNYQHRNDTDRPLFGILPASDLPPGAALAWDRLIDRTAKGEVYRVDDRKVDLRHSAHRAAADYERQLRASLADESGDATDSPTAREQPPAAVMLAMSQYMRAIEHRPTLAQQTPGHEAYALAKKLAQEEREDIVSEETGCATFAPDEDSPATRPADRRGWSSAKCGSFPLHD
jgi:hypothetical protein